jgi:hypothetical protein
LKFYFGNVDTKVKPTRNPDKIQAYITKHWELRHPQALDLIQNHSQRHGVR